MATNREHRDFARRLRSNMTDVERFVWSKLRRGQIGGYKFRRQHPSGPFVVDFVCLECRLAIELDGGQHAEQAEYDAARSRWLQQHGYTVLRYWNHEVMEDWETIERQIWDALQRAAGLPVGG
ncbi:MAG: DUF559 domain-containing protein [Fimbriiglobus sp.]|nr:DUF559 domain-containing protein [Fimbriiglobus sp.]